MSKSHRLAWAAGFLDGDGFITVQNRNQKIKGKEYKGYYLRVGACQANLAPLKELQSLFGGAIREKNSGPNREQYKRKTQWVWTLSTQEASVCLEQLYSYLVHKKEVAELAMEFQKTMGNHYKLSEEQWTYRALLKNKIQEINARD